jgi:hypothetical protein
MHRGASQGHGAWIAEAQGCGSLALSVVGLVGALEQRRADGTALTGTLDHKQPMVDLARLHHQLGQVLEPGQDIDVGRLVDHGLNAQCPPCFQISA